MEETNPGFLLREKLSVIESQLLKDTMDAIGILNREERYWPNYTSLTGMRIRETNFAMKALNTTIQEDTCNPYSVYISMSNLMEMFDPMQTIRYNRQGKRTKGDTRKLRVYFSVLMNKIFSLYNKSLQEYKERIQFHPL